MNRNLAGSNYGRSSIKFAHFIPIRYQPWSPQTILVSNWPIFKNLLLWNCLAIWTETHSVCHFYSPKKCKIYTNRQSRTCGKEFNTTAFVNLLICKANVNIILWRNLNIVSTKLFPEWLTSLSTSMTLKHCAIKRISHYSIDAPGHRLKVRVAY
jgi:hypothetical protein